MPPLTGYIFGKGIMKLTVLLDLDDTLLAGVGDHFMPAYMKGLCKRLSFASPQVVVQQLGLAVKKLEQKSTPALTLEEVFDCSFYPGIGRSKEELSLTLSTFYQSEFPLMKDHTRSLPAAKKVVDTLIEQCERIVIATSPLFPKTATLQRLAWAGFSLNDYHFDLISTYEDFHFAKPQPAYFMEIMARIGWPEDSTVVVIGDNLERDIYPALKLGLPAYHVQSGSKAELIPLGQHIAETGPLENVISWLEKLKSNTIKTPLDNCAANIAILSSTPAALQSLLGQLPKEIWQLNPRPGDWSFGEIICHMRDVDKEVHLPRFMSVINDENIFFPAIDTEEWSRERDYANQDVLQAMQDFMIYRTQLLDLIYKVPEERWGQKLRHAIFGPTCPGELLRFIARHDQNHIRQFFANKLVFQQQIVSLIGT